MYYLFRIGQALVEVAEAEEEVVLAQHRRYKELCECMWNRSINHAVAESSCQYMERQQSRVRAPRTSRPTHSSLV